MNNNYEDSLKDIISFQKSNSVYSNIDNINNDNSFLSNNKRKTNCSEIEIDNSNNKINSILNQSTKSIRLSKYMQNNNSTQIKENNKSKLKYQNYYAISQPNQRSLPNSVTNSIKKTKKISITFLKKPDSNNTNYTRISLKKDPTLRLQNNLKLFCDFNYKNKKTKESFLNTKRDNTNNNNNNNNNESNKSCKNNNKKIEYIKTPLCNSNLNLFDNKFIIKTKRINKDRDKKKEATAYTSRANSVHLSSEELDMNNIYKNIYTKRILMKEYNNQNEQIKAGEENKKIPRDISCRLYSNICSAKNKKDNYSQKYFKNKFLNKNVKNFSSKNILSKSKELNNNSIKKDIPLSKKFDCYLNVNDNDNIYNNDNNDTNKINKKITVNLNDKNIKIKNNKNIHINMNLINLPSQGHNMFTPLSTVFIQSHEKSLSILSTKNLNKKEYLSTSSDNNRISIESSYNFSKNNLNKFYDQNENSESNNIVLLMNKEMKRFRNNNTSFYLNGERNFFSSPDGPEDFHFRFVELCKQNNDFFKRLKLNIGNKLNKERGKKDMLKELYELENKKYFENIEEEVPYI